MVRLNFNISINDIMAESQAVIDCYLGQKRICSLSAENKTFCGNIIIDSDKVLILLKTTYYDDNQKTYTRNPVKKALSYPVLFLVNLFSVIEPLECPYDYQEEILFNTNGIDSEISIDIYRESFAAKPQAFIKSSNGLVKRTCKYSANRSVLKEIFTERKKAITVFSMFPSSVLLLLSLLSIIFKQYITCAFLLLIIFIFLGAFFYSRYHLIKQYTKYLCKIKS